MKTFIKILIGLLVLTAAFNASRAAFNNYSFEDAVHEALLFNPNAADPEIVKAVMKLANDYDIPLDAGSIQITSRGNDLIVNITYTDSVMLIPGVFEREWTFHPSTSTRLLGKGGRR